ncbi:hypothetical protein GCM10023149_13840 [Mucilaginibacter gynuensis]|uniref:Glycosyltransferase 2-like domain-containing protein n=1 Tax=Mucilaginibacter gynuensis TaxID=1302236 RepID=A0ABP8G3H4_9SPHI
MVSICIPTYNQAPYIELAVRSVYNQTVKPFEIIVFDDCSTDQTPQILEKLALEIPILKVFRQPHNLGIAGNVDSCLRAATGDLVVRLDSDDQLFPEYVEKLSALISEYPNAGYAHAAIQEVDQSNNFLNERRLFRKTGFVTGETALMEALKGYRVAANLIMFRREALVAVNYLAGRPNFGEDYHMASAISAAGYGNVYLNEILGYYRVWVDVGNVRQKRKLSEIDGIRRVFDDVLAPAFQRNGWGLTKVNQTRVNFAVRQSDCLGWDIYSEPEKEELVTAIYKLSSAPKVKFFVWLHSNKMGGLFKLFSNLKSVPKSIIKRSVLKLQTSRAK